MTKILDTQKFQEYCLITFMDKLGWKYSPLKHIFRKGGEDPISYNRAVRIYNNKPAGCHDRKYCGWQTSGGRLWIGKTGRLTSIVTVDTYVTASKLQPVERLYIKYSKRKHKVVCEKHKLQFINGYTLDDVELV